MVQRHPVRYDNAFDSTAEMKAATTTFKGRERQVKWEIIPHANETTIHFPESSLVCLLKQETVAKFIDTGNLFCVRLKLKWPLVQLGISKEHQFKHIISSHIVGVGHYLKANQVGRWIFEAKKLDQPQNLRGCRMPYRVFIFENESTLKNLKEIFFFPGLPTEIASLNDGQAEVNWLATWFEGFWKSERQQFEMEAKQLEAERLKTTPARFPHEDIEIDHHKNWHESVEKLLKKKWPNLTAAFMAVGEAKTEQEKLKFLAAYVADYTAIFRESPDVKKEDAAELLKDKSFIVLMNKAYAAPGSPVDEILWQLAIGWLGKNYYRMNEKQLEEAFNRDWNYQPVKHKGNTLAKYARDKIGLQFALKRGRPEEHPFDDSALRSA
jgi:hypothetical protein